jgi:hypothetical protein
MTTKALEQLKGPGSCEPLRQDLPLRWSRHFSPPSDVTRLDAVQNAALQDLASELDHRQMALLVVIKLAARYPNMDIGARVRAVRYVYLISNTRDDLAITRLGARNRGIIRFSREFYLCHRFLPYDTAPTPHLCHAHRDRSARVEERLECEMIKWGGHSEMLQLRPHWRLPALSNAHK